MKIIRGVYCSVLNNGRGSGRYNAATEPAKIKRYFRVPGAGGGEDSRLLLEQEITNEREKNEGSWKVKGRRGRKVEESGWREVACPRVCLNSSDFRCC